MEQYNKRYRDTVFRSYFNDADRLLTLCNALLGTNYSDAAAIQINTLEGTFFDRQKNDLSCKIGDNFLVLIEHQSSINENMPFRCLSYVAELMNNLVVNKRKLYHKALIMFPAPRFYVFYDGDDSQPVERQMRLSEAFSGDDTALELVVTALNINHGLKQPLLEKCQYLREYSTLVGTVKKGIALGLSRHDAISRAVKFCLDNGLMKGYLEKNSQEVFDMLALEWKMDDALAARYEDGRDDGISEGIEKVALNMIQDGEPLDKILRFTKLSMERIKELADIYKKDFTRI